MSCSEPTPSRSGTPWTEGFLSTQRPHCSLGRHTPAETYAARPKATSLGKPLVDPHGRIWQDVIDINGKFAIRHNSRLHHLGMGRTLARTPIVMLIHDLHVRIVHAATGELLRDLNIDPSRDYQPTGKTRYPRKMNDPEPP